MALVSRIDTFIGLFCKRALQKRYYSAKETYDFIDPTNRSHPIGLKTTLHSGHPESVLIDPVSTLTNKPWVRLTYAALNFRQWGYIWTTNLARQSGNNRSAPCQHRCSLGLQMHTRLSHSVPPPCFVGRLCEHASEEQKTGGRGSSERQ